MKKRVAPAALRNREPILEVLRAVARDGDRILELASGSGQHVCYFAQHLPKVTFQPSDADGEAIGSIDAYRTEAFLRNVLPALELDAIRENWNVGDDWSGVICINMIHIAPWEACAGLFRGAARALASSGWLLTYGPYRFSGRYTAPSNAEFDRSLRDRDPRWGVRDLDDLTPLAREHGFEEPAITALPANNHALLFRKA